MQKAPGPIHWKIQRVQEIRGGCGLSDPGDSLPVNRADLPDSVEGSFLYIYMSMCWKLSGARCLPCRMWEISCPVL